MFRKFDWWIIASVAILLAVGLVMLYSLSGTTPERSAWLVRQLVWVALGTGAFLFFALVDYRVFTTSKPVLAFVYLTTAAVLVLVLFFGRSISGNRAWFAIGSFTLQPVEFAKIALVLVLARYFSQKNIEIWQARHIILSGLLLCTFAGLVLLQPDTGSALLLTAIWFFMLLVSGVRVKHVALLVLTFMLVFVAAWLWFFTPNQKQRIVALINPNQDPFGAAYSQRQAIIAIGAGGLWGTGLGKGIQTQLGFLPASRTDFIFAAIGEELGFVGIAIVCASYVVLFWRLVGFAMTAPNNFVRLVVSGFVIAVFAQAAVDIGVNLGFVPVIGVGLPFVSYGGSNLLALLSGLGIIQSMRLRS